jgi:rare lipoprotein A
MRRYLAILTASALSGAALAAAFTQTGYAVYYTGKPDKETTLTAAHLTLPFGTWVKVTHARTGRTVTVKVNDRGPWNGKGRIIDVSMPAARQLGIIDEGVASVRIQTVERPQ